MMLTDRVRVAPGRSLGVAALASLLAWLLAFAPAAAHGQQAAKAKASTTKSAKGKAVKTEAASSTPAPPSATYWVYAGAESADLIHRIRFGPEGATVEKTIHAGIAPTEAEGPHGLQISRDGKYLHMTTGHGQPDGMYWKYALGPDTLAGEPIPLGWFPATLDVTADGLYAFIVNFNLHGEMVPSTVSVVYTPTNTEVARTTTCVMPHGSRLNAAGTKHYSGCMMSDQLVEIDARTFKVSHRFSLKKGAEKLLTEDEHAGHDASDMKVDNAEGHGASMTATCSPTWAQPAAQGKMVYVTCNKANEILEIDTESWAVARRLATGVGPYNLAVTPDGNSLLVTLKKGSGFQVIDLASGQSVYQDKTSNTLAHGVAVSPDSRYAFVTSEGVGAQPGKVDVFDLTARAKVASVDVGQQASGITFWKMEGH